MPQLMHALEVVATLVTEYMPATQLMQLEAEVEYDPVGQAPQVLEPTTDE